MTRLALSLLVLLGFVGCSRASEPARPSAAPAARADSAAKPPHSPDLSPDVAQVVTESNPDHMLRVVIVTGGFEHLSSRAYLQWLVPIPDPDADPGHRVVSTIPVEEVGHSVSLGPPRIEPAGAGFRVFLEGVNNKTSEERRLTLVVEDIGEYRAVP